jgi:hypothetical protein
LAAARATAPLVPDRPPGRRRSWIAQSTGWLLVLAIVAALPIRYGLGFGARYISIAGTLVLVVVAAAFGGRDAFARTPGWPARWLLQMTWATIAGLCSAATSLLVNADHTETRLLMAGAAGFLGAISVSAYLDRRAEQTHANESALPVAPRSRYALPQQPGTRPGPGSPW